MLRRGLALAAGVAVGLLLMSAAAMAVERVVGINPPNTVAAQHPRRPQLSPEPRPAGAGFSLKLQLRAGHEPPRAGSSEAQRLRQRRGAAVDAISLNNSQAAGQPTAYLVAMNVGTPPQEMFLLVDTGSSNVAVSATVGHPPLYNASLSSTARSSGGTIGVTYVDSSWSGPRMFDYLAIAGAPDTRVLAEFGAITADNNFFLPGSVYDGILGLAFQSIAAPRNNPVLPFFDTLTRQNPNISNVFSLQLCTRDRDRVQADGDGLMTIGGISSTASTGPIVYTPLQTQTYYSVQVTALAVAGLRLPLACGAYNSPGFSIVDSGTTDIVLPEAVFDTLMGAVDPSIRDLMAGGDQVCIGTEAATYLNGFFPTIVFTLVGTDGVTEFDLPVRPSHYFRYVGFDVFRQSKCYISTLSRSCNSGSGITLGVAMMSEYQVVFDREKSRVGFAVSTCANLGSTLPIAIAGPYPRYNVTSCAKISTPCTPKTPSPFTTLFYVAVVCGGIALIMIIAVLVWWVRTRQASYRPTVHAPSPAHTLLNEDDVGLLQYGYGDSHDLAVDMPSDTVEEDYDDYDSNRRF